jgi:glycosyltransferase involved in cell wall biosynthesis
MKIIIVVNFGFPAGMASTNRAKNLARGMIENNAVAEIIVPKPTERSNHVLNNKLSGANDWLEYRYTSSSTVVPNNVFVRRLMIVTGYLNCAQYLFKNRDTITAVILYLREISGLAFLATWCRLWGIPTILELCEWPVSHRNTGFKTGLQNWLLTTSSFIFVDGLITISSFLEQRVAKFNEKRKHQRPSILIPTLVNSDNYKCDEPYDPNGDLLFCGILDQTDIVLFLLKVASQLKKNGFPRKLIITGKAFIEQNLEIIRQEITRLELSQLIVLTGYVSDEELKKLYCTASALLAPLPSGERSIARFPNKIGEYLASGRPVVTTAIGDIPKYLIDKESAYLVKPDDIEGFTGAIIEILKNPKPANEIGKKGMEVAIRMFNPKDNGKKILQFINDIKSTEVNHAGK